MTDAKVPKALGAAGKALWKAVLGDVPAGWDLDARELHLLERACRCADELALLDGLVDRDGPMTAGSKGQPRMHPALGEARALRLAQLRLLGAIQLQPPTEQSAGTRQAKKAANARWNRRTGVSHLREAS
jgi:hypothetical protein